MIEDEKLWTVEECTRRGWNYNAELDLWTRPIPAALRPWTDADVMVLNHPPVVQQ